MKRRGRGRERERDGEGDEKKDDRREGEKQIDK